ncbi:glycosyltransferase [Clostridium perfringens]|uniref:glycosyltransferase n=1 Tax=Clostridium perfringens TaxID=1502 RepID=UPI002A263C60|nr:glycosyltransferase [Clostridium perfringens]MDK0756655.1 glycosyltransferase [Clostridium perfringens]
MNIMVFLPKLDYGGVSNYSIRCVEMLKMKYENVYLVTFRDSRNLINNEIQIIEGKNALVKFWNLRLFLKDKKINKIITSIDLYPLFLKVSSILLNIDIFSVIHMRPNLYKINTSSKIKNKIFNIILKSCFLISKKIITVSKDLEEEVRKTYGKYQNKIVTIYNPIIRKIEKEKKKYIKIESKKTINILTVGWIYDLKNQMEILEAINLLNDARIELNIVGGIGDDVYYKKLLRYINEHNMENVKFIGVVDDVKEYFKKADIYVLSSKSEALPTVLIEALENRVPIISNDCKVGPREILENGKFGIIYNLGSLDLKRKIEELIKDNKYYNMFIEKSPIKASEFTYKNILEQYSLLLEN